MAPLSVLDIAQVSSGATTADALAATTALARRTAALGYRRFWLAEHTSPATSAARRRY